jgi:hypothetical protein
MTDYKPQALPDPNAQLGHEGDPFRYNGIITFAVVFALVCALALVIVTLAMNGFKAEETSEGVTTKGLIGEVEGDFPAPRLQVNDDYDMVEFRKREDAALLSYGWADRKSGIAQIPIGRAIDLLAKNGLPKVKASDDQPAAPAAKPAGADSKPAATESGKKD